MKKPWLVASIIQKFNLLILDFFYFPFCRFFSAEPPLGFYDASSGCRYSFIRRLFLPNYSSQKEEFCKKCTSSRRIKRDSRPLHLIKPMAGDSRNDLEKVDSGADG